MDFDVKVIASLIGVAGLAVAALLSSLGYLTRMSLERNIYNTILIE